MKKIISVLLSLIVVLNSSPIFAMDSMPCPVSEDDYQKIRDIFRIKYSKNPHQHCEIKYDELRKPGDHRKIVVYNMPHLMKLKEGSKDNFLSAIVAVYSEVRMQINSIYEEHNVDFKSGNEIGKLFGTKMIEFKNKCEYDLETKKAIKSLADKMGVKEEDVRDSCTLYMATEAMSELQYLVPYLKKHPLVLGGVATTTLLGICSAIIGVFTKANMMKLAEVLGVGIPAIVLGGGLVIGSAAVATITYIHEQSKNAEVIFKIQRMQNVAKLIKQFAYQLTNSPEEALNSNVLIIAIDERRHSDGSYYEDKNMFWKWWNSKIEDQGSYCQFEYISGLDGAPTARNYESPDGRSLQTYVDFFKQNLENKIINYDQLKRFVENPKQVEREMGSKKIVAKSLKYIDFDSK